MNILTRECEKSIYVCINVIFLCLWTCYYEYDFRRTTKDIACLPDTLCECNNTKKKITRTGLLHYLCYAAYYSKI